MALAGLAGGRTELRDLVSPPWLWGFHPRSFAWGFWIYSGFTPLLQKRGEEARKRPRAKAGFCWQREGRRLVSEQKVDVFAHLFRTLNTRTSQMIITLVEKLAQIRNCSSHNFPSIRQQPEPEKHLCVKSPETKVHRTGLVKSIR